MNVSFHYPARYNFAGDAVCFDATADGQRVACVVPFEELSRRSTGVAGYGAAGYIGAFHAHRDALEDLARTLLARDGVPTSGLDGPELRLSSESL